MQTVFEKIMHLLHVKNIMFDITEHEPVRTSEEAARVRGAALQTGAKSMLLKAKDRYVLCVLPADRQIDWKKIKGLLAVKDIRFATEEEAENLLHVKMGSVPPFADLLGIDGYYDEHLFRNEYINFNPGSVTHTIRMKSCDLEKIVRPTKADITK